MSAEQHLGLHWVFGFFGMFLFLRALVLSRNAAVVGAMTFSCSGYVLSSLSFLNASTTIGILPWVLWAAVRDKVRITSVARMCMFMALLFISGEPALILLGSVLGLAVAARKSFRGALWFVGAALGALVLTAPVHYQTWLVARESARVVHGYTFDEAVVQSFHPMRLMEWLVPGIFGSPAPLLRGAWWGFRFSDDRLPYIYSVAIAFIPLLFLFLQVRAAWRTVDRFWAGILILTLMAAGFGHLPFADPIYASLGRGVLRYPIKFFLIATIAASVLGAQAFAFWSANATQPSRRTAKRLAIGIAVFLGCFALASAANPELVTRAMARSGWNDRWQADPAIVLAPIVAHIPVRLLFTAAMAGVVAWTIAKPSARRLTTTGLMVALDTVLLAPPLLPQVSAHRLQTPSPLLLAAAELSGRVCELTIKDIDPVRQGLRGRYESDATGELAVVQYRQAWAISGAPVGVRYAYNNSPDGSYSYRNQLVQEAIEAHGSWDYLLRWLRASGVTGLIAQDIGGNVSHLEEIAREESIGIPAVLYRIHGTQPPVRRTAHIVWVASPRQALEVFGRSTFDPTQQIVAEGSPRPLVAGAGSATIVQESADRVTIESDGNGPQMLFVARTYTSTAKAFVNGAPAPVLPANVHLLAVPVPRGKSTVTLRF